MLRLQRDTIGVGYLLLTLTYADIYFYILGKDASILLGIYFCLSGSSGIIAPFWRWR
jgi:hypothetical protein